jgi:5-oxoprolinase (ATP-hydrolysing) subunit A
MEINCDLGEVDTLNQCQQQSDIMAWIDRCNISCGSHAGSLEVTAATMLLAKEHQIKVGAHPGYDDREHFGRLSLEQPHEKTLQSIRNQLSNFILIAEQHHVTINHVKLHGALYNDVESNAEFAHRYVGLIQDMMPGVALLGLAGGELQKAVNAFDLGKKSKQCPKNADNKNQCTFIAEAFIDRAYLSSGQLAPRHIQGAVHSELSVILKQAQAIIAGTPISTLDGLQCVINAQSLCIHGDRADASGIAKALRQSASKNTSNLAAGKAPALGPKSKAVK